MSKATTRTPVVSAASTKMVCMSIFQLSTPPEASNTGASAASPGAEDVHRNRCAGTPIRHLEYPPLEVHPEIRCGKQILLELARQCLALGVIGQGREFGPAVGQRGKLMPALRGVAGGQRRPLIYPAAGSVEPHLGDCGMHRVDILGGQPGVDHLGIPLVEQVLCVDWPLKGHHELLHLHLLNAGLLR